MTTTPRSPDAPAGELAQSGTGHEWPARLAIVVSLLLPTAAGLVFGLTVGLEIGEVRGAAIDLPAWLCLASWLVGVAMLPAYAVLGMWRRVRIGVGAHAVRIGRHALLITGLLCAATSMAVPS